MTTAAAPPVALPTGTAMRYQVRMLTDWHVGTGTGRPGDVDRLVARDADGLPYLPAKTVTGMWRDACEIAARALDAEPDPGSPGRAGSTGSSGVGGWARLVDVLFGTQPSSDTPQLAPRPAAPRPAALSVRAARYRKLVRDAVAAEPALLGVVTFRKPGLKLDALTGLAEDRHLRFTEQGRVGSVLEGSVVLDPDGVLDDDTRRYATALLLAGSVLVEQVGGNRRRGGGRCALTFGSFPPSLEEWWRWLESAAPPAAVAVPYQADADAVHRASPSGTGWEVADLRIILRDPLLVAPQTAGNEVRGADFVPGATMLPVVLRRLGPVATGALLDGRLLVTDATVEVRGEPGRPAPRTLRTSKASPAGFFNAAVESADVAVEPVRGGYVAEGMPLAYLLPTVGTRTHNSIDDTSQRPTRHAGGGMFTYQALLPRDSPSLDDAGTAPPRVLRAQVRVRPGVLPAGWQHNLAGAWTLGRSRKDEYGRVDVEASPGQPPPVRSAFASCRRVMVWLLGDLLLLDERLRPATDPRLLYRAVADALGVGESALTPVQTTAAAAEARVLTALATRRTDSWQARWGLPRPSLLTFAAGSVVTFDVAPSVALTPEILAEVEAAGLGERRGEGLGQVRVAIVPQPGLGEPPAGDDAGPAVLTAQLGGAVPARPGQPAPPHPAPPHPAWSADLRVDPDDRVGLDVGVGPAAQADPAARADMALVAGWRREAWRAEIARRVTACAAARNDVDPATGRSHPSGVLGREGALGVGVERLAPSQLEQLRELPPLLDDPDQVRAWLARASDPTRRRVWQESVAQAATLLLADDPGRVWTVLGWKKTDLCDDPALRAELWPEAVTALVLACLTALRRQPGPGSGVGRGAGGRSAGQHVGAGADAAIRPVRGTSGSS